MKSLIFVLGLWIGTTVFSHEEACDRSSLAESCFSSAIKEESQSLWLTLFPKAVALCQIMEKHTLSHSEKLQLDTDFDNFIKANPLAATLLYRTLQETVFGNLRKANYNLNEIFSLTTKKETTVLLPAVGYLGKELQALHQVFPLAKIVGFDIDQAAIIRNKQDSKVIEGSYVFRKIDGTKKEKWVTLKKDFPTVSLGLFLHPVVEEWNEHHKKIVFDSILKSMLFYMKTYFPEAPLIFIVKKQDEANLLLEQLPALGFEILLGPTLNDPSLQMECLSTFKNYMKNSPNGIGPISKRDDFLLFEQEVHRAFREMGRVPFSFEKRYHYVLVAKEF